MLTGDAAGALSGTGAEQTADDIPDELLMTPDELGTELAEDIVDQFVDRALEWFDGKELSDFWEEVVNPLLDDPSGDAEEAFNMIDIVVNRDIASQLNERKEEAEEEEEEEENIAPPQASKTTDMVFRGGAPASSAAGAAATASPASVAGTAQSTTDVTNEIRNAAFSLVNFLFDNVPDDDVEALLQGLEELPGGLKDDIGDAYGGLRDFASLLDEGPTAIFEEAVEPILDEIAHPVDNQLADVLDPILASASDEEDGGPIDVSFSQSDDLSVDLPFEIQSPPDSPSGNTTNNVAQPSSGFGTGSGVARPGAAASSSLTGTSLSGAGRRPLTGRGSSRLTSSPLPQQGGAYDGSIADRIISNRDQIQQTVNFFNNAPGPVTFELNETACPQAQSPIQYVGLKFTLSQTATSATIWWGFEQGAGRQCLYHGLDLGQGNPVDLAGLYNLVVDQQSEIRAVGQIVQSNIGPYMDRFENQFESSNAGGNSERYLTAGTLAGLDSEVGNLQTTVQEFREDVETYNENNTLEADIDWLLEDSGLDALESKCQTFQDDIESAKQDISDSGKVRRMVRVSNAVESASGVSNPPAALDRIGTQGAPLDPSGVTDVTVDDIDFTQIGLGFLAGLKEDMQTSHNWLTGLSENEIDAINSEVGFDLQAWLNQSDFIDILIQEAYDRVNARFDELVKRTIKGSIEYVLEWARTNTPFDWQLELDNLPCVKSCADGRDRFSEELAAAALPLLLAHKLTGEALAWVGRGTQDILGNSNWPDWVVGAFAVIALALMVVAFGIALLIELGVIVVGGTTASIGIVPLLALILVVVGGSAVLYYIANQLGWA